MTIGNLKERLGQFRQDIRHYQDQLRRRGAQTRPTPDDAALDAMREKLVQEYQQLADAIAMLSQGKYRIGLQTGALVDLYASALASPDGQGLETMRQDLDHIIAELDQRPAQTCLEHPKRIPYMQSGFLPVPPSTESEQPATEPSLGEFLQSLAAFVQHRLDHETDRAVLLSHVKAVLDHPAMGPWLSMPLAHILRTSPSS